MAPATATFEGGDVAGAKEETLVSMDFDGEEGAVAIKKGATPKPEDGWIIKLRVQTRSTVADFILQLRKYLLLLLTIMCRQNCCFPLFPLIKITIFGSKRIKIYVIKAFLVLRLLLICDTNLILNQQIHHMNGTVKRRKIVHP